MKILLELEVDLNLDQELNVRQERSVTGMVRRLSKNRLQALVGRRLGDGNENTEWEAVVKSLSLNSVSKVK